MNDVLDPNQNLMDLVPVVKQIAAASIPESSYYEDDKSSFL